MIQKQTKVFGKQCLPVSPGLQLSVGLHSIIAVILLYFSNAYSFSQDLSDPRPERRPSISQNQLKEQFSRIQRQKEAEKLKEQCETYEIELRRYRREQQLQRQALERSLLIEVSKCYLILSIC